jgi:hypothetical protein
MYVFMYVWIEDDMLYDIVECVCVFCFKIFPQWVFHLAKVYVKSQINFV